MATQLEEIMAEGNEREDMRGRDDMAGSTQINAPTALSNLAREEWLAPTVGVQHFIPQDEQVNVKLIEIEKLIRHRNYHAAIREAGTVDLKDTHFAATYALVVHEKLARARIALGDRYLARGDKERAMASYGAALKAQANPASVAVANLTANAVTDLVKSRSALIDRIGDMLIGRDYAAWCDTRRQLGQSSILDHVTPAIVAADISLTDALGPRVPVYWPPKENLQGGWADPAPIDELGDGGGLGAVLLERPVLRPGTRFSSSSASPVSLKAIESFSQGNDQTAEAAGPTVELRASSTFPVMTSLLNAHARMFAVTSGLSPVGLSAGSVQLYRYPYLVERARKILDFVTGIDARMAPLQFKLDDFIATIAPLESHIAETSSELQALETRIVELQTTLASLTDGEEKLGKIVQQLSAASDACDPEWWEYVLSVVVVIAATAVGALVGFLIGGIPGAVAGGLMALGTSIGLTIQVWKDREITCENVSTAQQDFSRAHGALKVALDDHKAELHYALLQRDGAIASLASLQAARDAASKGDEARILNSKTLNLILGVLDNARSTAIMRAHALAAMAQNAYNAENDVRVNVIADSHSDYLDQDAHGYTAAAVLQRDLDGLEHIRLTGHVRKSMQLAQTVSLSKHYPSALASILASGTARFATRLSDFDHWFPGTYLHRLKEVRVEIWVDKTLSAVRGYLTNDGVSFVRFADVGNRVALDQRDVLAEPDRDLRQLCYKRRRRHHAVETMAFPAFSSALYEARACELQTQERNFFEGCGLESTWLLELTPDQALEYARITDVKIHFQFEAQFDPALKQVVEAKRYTDRKETALLSMRATLEQAGKAADFSAPVKLGVGSFMFEAPHLDKTIRDVAVVLRPKEGPLLTGKAKLRIDYQGQGAVDVETNEQGIVATAAGKPAGGNTGALQALTQGKSAIGEWLVQILALPAGVQAADIDDVLLMIPYAYEPA